MAGLKAVGDQLQKLGLQGVEIREWRNSIVLEGRVDEWQQYIDAGYAAVGKGFKGVVNDIEVVGVKPQPMYQPPQTKGDLEGATFDVVVVGGGVIGCAIARELTRWNLTVAILEKEEDVAKQTSSRNNGMIHPGIAASYGTKKLDYNIRGNKMYGQVAEELDFDLLRCGSLVLLEKGWHKLFFPQVRRRALKKGVDGINLVWPKDVLNREPNVTPRQRGALSLPSTGVVAPYKVTVGYAENAVENGARIFLNTVVTGFEKEGNRITGVRTNRGRVRGKVVINAAGVWADKVADMAGDRFFTIHGRKGTIAILDKNTGRYQDSVLAMPRVGEKSHTKGGGLNPTVEGNILAGPTAIEVPHREDWTTTAEEMEFIFRRHLMLNRELKKSDIITYFAGVRACTFEEDFIIEASEYVSNLVHVAGIQSPGLAAAPAIAQDVANLTVELLQTRMEVKENPRFNPKRQGKPELATMSLEDRGKLIAQNPGYGRIVCRCEVVSQGEVEDAIDSVVPATTLDAIKRRTRAGMGRCQGGFCTPALVDIVAKRTGVEPTQVLKGRSGSHLLTCPTKTKGVDKRESC